MAVLLRSWANDSCKNLSLMYDPQTLGQNLNDATSLLAFCVNLHLIIGIIGWSKEKCTNLKCLKN